MDVFAFARNVVAWLLALLAAPASALAGNTITTVAGTGAAGVTGDGGQAVSATLNTPRGIAELGDGSYLIADTTNNRIRKVSPAGVITTVAGTGVAGSAGDGLAATLATLSNPRDVAVAPDGVTYYIADGAGNRIRAVDSSGIITRVAGTGTASSTGDGAAATSATINSPSGLSVDSAGNLYIAETTGNRIRHVAADSGTLVTGAGNITTVAGTGASGATGDGAAATLATLNAPQDVLWTGGSDFLIADTGNFSIRSVTSGTINRVVGTGAACTATALCGDGGLASLAGLGGPYALSTDRAGGYLIADSGGNRVRQVASTGTITTLAGTGTTCTTTARCGDGGPAELANLGTPRGVFVNAAGVLYIADTANRIRVRIVDPGGTGPAGPAGPAGPTGPAGPAGATGATGPAGADGSNGPAGPAGSDGPAGATGAAGPQGPGGADGANGLNGAPGAPGQNGANGRDGLTGPAGAIGPIGPQGPKGDGVSALPLVVALSGSRISLRASSHTILRLFVTGPAGVTVRITRGTRAVRMSRATFKTLGRKSIDLRRLRRGRYRLVVIAEQGEQFSVDRAVLVVR